MKFDKRIVEIFKELRIKKIYVFIFMTIVLTIKFSLIYLIQKSVDNITKNNFNELKNLSKIAIFLILALFIFNYIFQKEFRKLQYTSHFTLLNTLYFGALKNKNLKKEKLLISDELTIIKDDSKIVSFWFSIGIITMIFNCMTFLLAFSFIVYYNFIIGILTLFLLLTCLFLTYLITQEIGKQTYNYQNSISLVTNWIFDSLNGYKDIVELDSQKFFLNKMSEKLKKINKTVNIKLAKYTSFYTTIYGVLNISLPFIIIFLGIFLILEMKLTIGSLIAIITLIGFMQEPVLTIPDFINKRNDALVLQNRLLKYLEKEDFYEKGYNFEDFEVLSFVSKGVKLDKVILKDINFIIKKNEHTMFIGESGKGKTTIFNLISRFLTDKNVEIKYNFVNINDISMSNYYKNILQVTQNPILFQVSLIENITLGEQYSKFEIEEILNTTCLKELFDKKGWNYLVLEKGQNLSGGEKQRINIARILIRRPKIIMLDEPTTGLNFELSKKLMENLLIFAKKYEITLFIITHDEKIRKEFENYFNIIKL